VAGKLKRDLPLDNYEIVRWNLFGSEQIRSFLKISQELEIAQEHGFTGRHCQGGGYAMTRSFVHRMNSKHYIEDSIRFLHFPMAEDRVAALHCAVLGLSVRDFSDCGEVFGVQASGLPFSPAQLLGRGHSVIHSVRNNRELSEADIRGYFARLRGSSDREDAVVLKVR
jgi:hypothetical protein